MTTPKALNEHQALIIRALENMRGDDTIRARAAFRHCTPEQMQEEYGEGGMTRQEILDGYTARDARVDAAIQWTVAQGRDDQPWLSLETAPRDGTYILLAGPSGYTTTPMRVEVCRYAEHRPWQPWVNHANDSFLDGGEEPTHWRPLPSL